MSYRQCIMLMMDGARADVFEALLAKGDLPHIARHVIEPGCYRRAVTAFPSSTGPAYLPFLTGALPATCNVPGLRWMDKARYRDGSKRGLRSYIGIESMLFNRDIHPDVETLFEIFPESYNVMSVASRGVARKRDLTYWHRMLYKYYAHLTDHWDSIDRRTARRLQSVVESSFQFLFAVFFGVDEYAHLAGPFSEPVMQSYRAIDTAIGAMAQRLQRRGRSDETVWWLVSDHGLTDTHTHFCVGNYLEARHCRTLSYPFIFRRGCQAANMVCGNAMTHLYFRHRDGWAQPVTADYLQSEAPLLLEGLLHQPAVELMALRGADGRVIVKTRDGEAHLTPEPGGLQYHGVTGDPLGLLPTATGQCTLTTEESLQASFTTRYPDAAYQLLHLFTSPRTGDVVLCAAPGYDLRKDFEFPEHRGSHGSLHCDHMWVPLACSAPLQAGPVRTIDVFPTTLHLMGKSPLRPTDGICRALQ